MSIKIEQTRSSKYKKSGQELNAHDIVNQLNIRYRVCCVYSPDKNPESTGELCECGKEEADHRIKDVHQNSWSMERNTQEKVDPQHGQFPNKTWYVRLALDTPQEKVEKILLEAWKIPNPRFIVSIIGGAKYFKLNERLETNFINGIVEVIEKSNAWLLTNGYNVGIVQLVGQAINKVKLTNLKTTITAIGICKWGCIKDIETIIMPKNERTQQATTEPTTNENDNQRKKERVSGTWNLETNHSHYLMLDDGTRKNYDTKEFRTRLATHMARLQHEHDVFVPVVTIVVEGGKDTIANIYYDLKSSIPVIIIDGSGRTADFFARMYLYTKGLESNIDRETVYGIDELNLAGDSLTSNYQKSSNNNEKNPSEVHVDANTKMLSTFFVKYKTQIEIEVKNTIYPDSEGPEVDKKVADTTYQVMYCLQPAVRSDITIFNLNSDSDLTETIFRSICQSRQKLSKRKETENNSRKPEPKLNDNRRKNMESSSRSSINQKEQSAERSRLLDLAMDWDCIDVAKEFIFQNSLDNILNKNKAFITALTKNLPMFVYEFLKLGINPSEVFFGEDGFYTHNYRYKKFFKSLYTHEAVNSQKTHLRCFIEPSAADSGKIIDSVDTLNTILEVLIGDYMHKLYFNTLKQEEANRISWGLKKPEETFLHKPNRSDNLSLQDKIKLDQMSQDYIMRDLFIWSVLMNYPKLAIVFLSYMKYRICPALIATKIFKQYYHKAPYGETKDSYKESADDFEKYAKNCLDKSDDHDEQKACQVILQQNELYGYASSLQVAADADDKLFMAEPCSVEAMNNIWYDKVRPEQRRKRDYLTMFIGFISLGLLAPVFVSYRESDKEPPKDKSKLHTLNARGINYCDPDLIEYPNGRVRNRQYTRYIPKLIKFHESLPAKFLYHITTYAFFLLLFSYVLLFNFSPPTNEIPSIHWTEILTIILVSFMLIEETHFFFSQDNLTFWGRTKNYFRDLFKPLTLLAFLLFYIGLIVRFRNANSETEFIAARVIMAIDLELWWLRTLSFIIVIPFLGPHLVAIGKMLKDLFFFMCIIAIVMAGYGVASRSMVYFPVANNFTTETGGPIDASFDGRSVFRHIAYPVYYLLYGEFGNELNYLDSNPNAGWSIATHVLLAIHMLFVNILLTNMLIAMFSKRFDEVYQETQNIWHSQQYLFTREYFTRSFLFPPISLFYDIYYLCRMLYFLIKRKVFKKPGDYNAKVFKIVPEKETSIKEWSEFEDASTYEYAHGEVKTLKTTPTKSTFGSSSDDKNKKDDTTDNDNDPNNAFNRLKQLQNDLIDMSSVIEGMKEKLETRNKNKK